MELLEAILSCICVAVFAMLGIAFLIIMICAAVRERKQNKKHDAWEEETHQMERDRAIRDTEYHTARMKKFESE
jgi:uncharacterized membrane protein